MFLFDFFRSFLPLHNPIGFGAADFVEFVIAALLVLLVFVWRPILAPYAARLANRTAWCMLLLAVLPVGLRLLLLPHHPVPTPEIYDEFGHLLVADTLRHFRLANPPHSLPQFFETFFVLQQPTYSSIYPIGQGLVLAVGRAVLGSPWAGVLLAMAAFCALCYWMLRAWVAPGWAFLGGMLAVLQFGPLNQWCNCYWGGFVAAAAGCLVFGALPRIRDGSSTKGAIALGAGLALHLLTRPYESVFLLLAVLLYFAPYLRKPALLRIFLRPAAVTILVVMPAVAVTLLQNRQVTGSWTTLPYVLSQYQYGVPSALTFQQNPVPHRELTREQQLDYQMQVSFHGPNTDTLRNFLLRLEYRVRFYRFFFLAPLYLALPAFLFALREFRYAWVLATLTLFALGINFFPAFQFHYLAGVTCLFILVSLVGLERMSRWKLRGMQTGADAALLIVFLSVAHFAFWYGLHLADNSAVSMAMRRYETWNDINHRDPEARIEVRDRLAGTPGKLLVLVRYWPQHIFQNEWVYNEADIDNARIVWARDLGPRENRKILNYYRDRAVWLLEPDFRPPRLTPYQQ